MSLVEVTDTETDETSKVEVTVSPKFPPKVYRNSDTKALDAEHASLLSKGMSPLFMGSCFTEGEIVLPLFADPAPAFGFYFGVEENAIPAAKRQYLNGCEREHTIRRVDYKERRLVFPIKFM